MQYKVNVKVEFKRLEFSFFQAIIAASVPVIELKKVNGELRWQCGALETVPKWLEKGVGISGKRRKNCDHSDFKVEFG